VGHLWIQMREKVMSKGISEPKEDYTPTVNFRTERKSKIQLDLNGIELDDTIRATVTGKVTSLNEDKYGDSLTLKVSSIKLDKEGSTMIEALKKIKKG